MPPITSPPVPMPADWARVHARLAEDRIRLGDTSVPEPPVPLILAGAAFSTATEIQARWRALLDWAHAHGLEEALLSNLGPLPDCDVARSIAGVSDSGQGWWPQYGEQNHSPRARPTAETVHDAFAMLASSWTSIVGLDFAASTRPLRLTGKKFRHLVVAADPSARPSWGSWNSRHQNPRVFTAFRKAINDSLTPLEVDHVSFTTDAWRRAA